MINFFKNRKYLIVGGIVVVGVILIIVLPYGFTWFNQWNGERGVENLKRSLEKAAKDDYDLAMSDTYGGKTPKETLEMFIAAIEKNDFELASKYFILSKQGEWKDKLINGKQNNNLEKLLKLVNDEVNILDSSDPLWTHNDNYVSTNRVFFDYVKYPNGIWKIREI